MLLFIEVVFLIPMSKIISLFTFKFNLLIIYLLSSNFESRVDTNVFFSFYSINKFFRLFNFKDALIFLELFGTPVSTSIDFILKFFAAKISVSS